MKELEEAQKSMLDILKIIHTRTYNMLLKSNRNENIKEDLVKLLDFEFDEMRVIEKDIKISESDAGNTNSL